MESRTFNTGDVIFRQGDASNGEAYQVQEGAVEVRKSEDGEERILRKLGKGDLLGEVALFRSAPHSATAIATEPVTVLVIPEHRLEEMVRAESGTGHGADPAARADGGRRRAEAPVTSRMRRAASPARAQVRRRPGCSRAWAPGARAVAQALENRWRPSRAGLLLGSTLSAMVGATRILRAGCPRSQTQGGRTSMNRSKTRRMGSPGSRPGRAPADGDRPGPCPVRGADQDRPDPAAVRAHRGGGLVHHQCRQDRGRAHQCQGRGARPAARAGDRGQQVRSRRDAQRGREADRPRQGADHHRGLGLVHDARHDAARRPARRADPRRDVELVEDHRPEDARAEGREPHQPDERARGPGRGRPHPQARHEEDRLPGGQYRLGARRRRGLR